MSIHIPWAEDAQLTEFSTETNFVGPLRACVQRYTQLSPEAQQNALVIADAQVPLPGRDPTKILERPELEILLGLFEIEPIRSIEIAGLIDRRDACRLAGLDGRAGVRS